MSLPSMGMEVAISKYFLSRRECLLHRDIHILKLYRDVSLCRFRKLLVTTSQQEDNGKPKQPRSL
jgi:hypothetical protein